MQWSLSFIVGPDFLRLRLRLMYEMFMRARKIRARFNLQNHTTLAKNIEWICARAEDYKIPKETTEVLVDPPRAGLHKNVIEQLLKLKPRSISYVSCDPASFSRDVKQFSKDYRIQRLVLLDLFSQTYHFETIAQLVR